MRRGIVVSVALTVVLIAAACSALPISRPSSTASLSATPPRAAGAAESEEGEQREEKERKKERKKEEKDKKERYKPTGHLRTVDGHSVDGGHGSTVSFTVEVEDGIAVDPKDFAKDVEKVLFDRRSWPERFERVDHGAADFRLILASPELTDELCLPLDTAGIYSCFQPGRVVLNAMRWKRGADAYGDDLKGYRIYMVNHEVGHALGHDHLECPGSGEKAPVMMQQTKGVAPCEPNPWP